MKKLLLIALLIVGSLFAAEVQIVEVINIRTIPIISIDKMD